MHGRRRARQVVDLVDLEQDLLDDVVADQLEVRLPQKVRDVVLGAREKVVEADDVVAALDEVGAEVGPDEAGPARDDDAVGLDAGLGLDEGGGVGGALLFVLLLRIGGGVFNFEKVEAEKEEKRARLLLLPQLSIESKASIDLARFPPSFCAFGFQSAAVSQAFLFALVPGGRRGCERRAPKALWRREGCRTEREFDRSTRERRSRKKKTRERFFSISSPRARL